MARALEARLVRLEAIARGTRPARPIVRVTLKGAAGMHRNTLMLS
jgi:hypothetical protein